MRERSPCPRPCSLSGMLSAWGSGFPPDSRGMGRRILSRVESPPPHPKGRPLVCLVETPGGGGGGGQQQQQSPPHCPGGAFLREGGGATRGTRTTPPPQPAQLCLPAPRPSPESFWGNWEEHLCLGGQSLCLLEATPELAPSPWGRCTFHHTGWSPAFPLQVLGAGEAERSLESVLAAASPSCSSPSLGTKPAHYPERKLIQEINFSSV